MMLPFTVTHVDPDSGARAAELETPHGLVRTPAFMPVGTAGTVKGVAAWELDRLAPEMVLANTYHLLLRPGVDRVERLGGLHRVLGWSGPVLTDSGGYQVFSLAGCRRLDDDGVSFRSHLDGNVERLTPDGVIEAQARFGVDVAMVLDECPASDAPGDEVARAVERSSRWAAAGLEAARRRRADHGWAGGVFAIQQGALDPALRRRSTEALVAHGFDGFAVGGLAVGESNAELHDAVAMAAPMLPSQRPRYLMGVGYPEDLLHAVGHGVDLFDCVLPTRSARTGKAFTSRGEVVIKNARWADDDTPLDPHCGCPTCARYSKAVLRHLFVAREVTSVVLLTVHNLTYFLSLMREARAAIIAGRYTELRRRALAARSAGGPDRGTADSAR